MVRYNNLKIFINVLEAKPGGNIGAMLSPYLFSNNMTEFCKQFNELTCDFNLNLSLNVKIYVDVVEKVYSFYINLPNIVLIFNYYSLIKKLTIFNLYDILKYISFIYNLSIYKSFFIGLGIFKSFKKKRIFLDFKDIFFKKLRLYNNVS